MPTSGDLLLFTNNVVLGVMFIPTLLKRDANVHRSTAAVYVLMISIAAIGYELNGQWLPAIPTAIGAFLWLLMFIKS